MLNPSNPSNPSHTGPTRPTPYGRRAGGLRRAVASISSDALLVKRAVASIAMDALVVSTPFNRVHIDHLSSLSDDAIAIIFSRADAQLICNDHDSTEAYLNKIIDYSMHTITDAEWTTICAEFDYNCDSHAYDEFESVVLRICYTRYPRPWNEIPA